LTAFIPEFVGMERPQSRVEIPHLSARSHWFEEEKTSVHLLQRGENHPHQQGKHRRLPQKQDSLQQGDDH
jgi:hypothetical protein